MLPGYRYFGHMYYWPAWVHLIVIALMGVAAALTIAALMARGVGRSRVFGLSCGFVAGIGNLSLCVLVQAEARHQWQMGMVGALYTVAFVFLLMTLVSLWSGGSSGFLWSRWRSPASWSLPTVWRTGFRCPSRASLSSSLSSVHSSPVAIAGIRRHERTKWPRPRG